MTKQRYDITIRDILTNPSNTLIKFLTGKNYKKVLNPNFPKTSERIADLLLELEDGTILHLEIQSTNNVEK